jgi:hypothetical protein
VDVAERYQSFVLDAQGTLLRRHDFGASGEEEARETALVMAREVAGASSIELWLGTHRLAVLPCDPLLSRPP